MSVALVIFLTMAVTTFGIIVGCNLAKLMREQDDLRFWADMSIEDILSETPIASKLDRKYGIK
jgi:hypothetical protein